MKLLTIPQKNIDSSRKNKTELKVKLEKQKKKEELATNLKIITVRSDNAAKISEKIDNWSKQVVRCEPIIIHERSHQNEIAERNIQHVETGIRSSLKDARLPLEFWVGCRT